MTEPAQQFRDERASRIDAYAANASLRDAAKQFLVESIRSSYTYNFEWLSRPIIQYPQDILAVQELIWRIKPDLIIETGIAHGGSLVMSASILALLDYSDAVLAGTVLDPTATRRRVLGIDIDIRAHNRAAIQAHAMAHRIDMIEGSSIDPLIVARAREIAKGYSSVLVCLDSNHTYEHVRAELEAYAPLVTQGSYCVIFDTVVEELPRDMYPDRPWSVGDNPMTAVNEFLGEVARRNLPAIDGERLLFEIDSDIDRKLLVSCAPRGYLRRVKHGSS